MIRPFAFGLALAGVLALYACKDDDPHPPAADENGGSDPPGSVSGGSNTVPNENDSGVINDDGGIVSADGAVTTCTDLALTGLVIDEDETDGTLPASTGGQIQNGIYNLTKVTRYVAVTGTTTGITYQQTIQVTNGNTFQRVSILSSNATVGTAIPSSGVMVPTSPTLSITFTCPSQTVESYQYTVSGSTLVLSNIQTNEQFTYTLK